VRTEKGVDMGEVMELRGRVDGERAAKLMPVVRKASADDLTHIAEQQEREKQALEICAEAIEQHDLPMKLIDANLSFDNTRLVFFFSADGRVDFRELVRDLARTFRMRIELRQIGVRDEAKLLGGLGPCGRRLCCKTFMRDFEPVGIRVAKDQGLALNPAKISGLCDRLMCCLLFEHKTYCALRDELPKRGERVMTEQGPGTVKDVALIKEELHIALDDGSEVRLRACRVWPVDEERPAHVETAADGDPEMAAGAASPGAPPSTRIPRSQPRQMRESPAAEPAPERPAGQEAAGEEPSKPKRRRRRPRKRRPAAEGEQATAAPPADGERAASSGERTPSDGSGQREGRRRSRRSRGRSGGAEQRQAQDGGAQSQARPPGDGQAGESSGGEAGSSRRRRGRRRSRRKGGGQGGQSQGGGGQQKSGDGGST